MCVKQVPDRESTFRVDEDGKGFDEAGTLFRMNSYDEYAVEEAVRIKEERSQVEITALTVGPGRAEAVVRRAMELGADHGAHLLTGSGQGMDSLQTASRVASFAKEKGFDLILCGVMSEDEQCCQTGPMVAVLLGLPYATTVIAERILEGEQRVRVERELEGGRRQVVELPLPAVLTVQSGINEPRYPTLPGIMKAKKKRLDVKKAADIGASAKSKTDFIKMFFPVSDHKAEILQGDAATVAAKLVEKLKNEAKVI